MAANFYVYLHRNKLSEVILVGKGVGRRVLSAQGRPRNWTIPHSYQIIKTNLTEYEALQLESELILQYQNRKTLCNINKSKSLNLQILKENIVYSEESPSGLIWLKNKTCGRGRIRVYKGQVAGCLSDKGAESYDKKYVVSVEKMKTVMAHRVIWALFYGLEGLEHGVVDHIDGNPLNNKINNLRLVSSSINQKNKSSKNVTGHTGITWSDKKKRCRLRFTVENKVITKYFSEIKYLTKDAALQAARDYKTNNKEYFLQQGYSERYLNGNN